MSIPSPAPPRDAAAPIAWPAWLAPCILLFAFGVACSGSGGGGGDGGGNMGGATPLLIPQQGDWADRGSTTIEASGVPGEWDYRLDGAISPVAAIKRGGTYFLYYTGADGDRGDGGPRHRALGVATSNDGLLFAPHPSNPIVTNLPNGSDEEGIFSGEVVIDDGGNTILYYGALEETSPGATSVFSDARRASSTNGITFSPVPGPVVLNHSNGGVFNFGDEIYPIGVFRNGSMFHLYYTSQGTVDNWALGLASGSSSSFTSTQGLITPANASQEVIGGGSVIRDTADSFLLFTLRSFTDRVIDVRDVPTANPADIGSPIRSYTGFPNVQNFVVLLDEAEGQWFLYVAELSFIRVYTASVQRM